MGSADLTYRKTATEGASGFGLLIALFDTLSGDLRRAAEAQRRRQYENRCREVEHALRVIAHLENWLPREGGGDLTLQLRTFYAKLRRKLVEAQVKQSAELIEEEMREILKIRVVWQQLEQTGAGSQPGVFSPEMRSESRAYTFASDHRSGGWSA